MTVKELKEKLEQFPDNCVVLIPNRGWRPYLIQPTMIPATSVTTGVNEFDGYVIIDDYVEAEDV